MVASPNLGCFLRLKTEVTKLVLELQAAKDEFECVSASTVPE